MSDGYANGPYHPITDADIMSDSDISGVLGLLKPPYGNHLARHMMAMERKIARLIEEKMKKTADQPTSPSTEKTHAKYQERIEQCLAGSTPLQALAELVACKDLHDRAEALPHGDADYPALNQEYRSRKTAAWDAARAVLADAMKNAPQL